MANRAHLAWCAGFIDGEGCIGIHRNGRNPPTATLRVSVTSEEAVSRLQYVFGGIIRSYKRPAPRIRYWRWYVGRRSDLSRVLTAILPFLTVKRKEAELALRYLDGDNTIAEMGAMKHNRRPTSAKAKTARKKK